MDEIIDYVMETPQNTNPNVLRGMLENLSGGGGSSTFIITLTTNDGEHFTSDKTETEILQAFYVDHRAVWISLGDNTIDDNLPISMVLPVFQTDDIKLYAPPMIVSDGRMVLWSFFISDHGAYVTMTQNIISYTS